MVKRCVDALGAVDILVAAAGIGAVRVPGATSYQPHTVLSIPMDQFRRVIDVNLYGVLFSNRAVARWMTEHRRGGSIIPRRSCRRCRRRAPYSVTRPASGC
jgi:meso-butanediol dehydrogenase/(S,S)-butanediol dehydrogenase/diacetyl reductase